MSRADAIGAAYLHRGVALHHRPEAALLARARPGRGTRSRRSAWRSRSRATLFDERVVTYWWIIVGALIGGVGGAIGARRVKMTAMPQMVALFNGLGGGAAALVALADYHDTVGLAGHVETKIIISILFSAVVGSVSFAGSMIAFGKLQDIVTGNPVTVPGQRLVTGAHLRCDPGRVRLTSRPAHESQALLVGHLRRLSHPRRADGDGDRRRRHARRHLAPERVHRPGNGVDGLRPLEQRPHHLGHPRRSVGQPAHPDDGQGDEPVARQHGVRRVRHGRQRRGRGGPAAATAASAQRAPTTSPSCWRTPAGS